MAEFCRQGHTMRCNLTRAKADLNTAARKANSPHDKIASLAQKEIPHLKSIVTRDTENMQQHQAECEVCQPSM